MAQSLRRMPERLLHPLRRRTALRWLRGSPPPRAVLVVCQGNICRSPYAAALLGHELRRSLQDTVRVESAGFLAPGRPCPTIAVEVAAARGVDLSRHRSQALTPHNVGVADLVVVMDRAQRGALRKIFPGGRQAVVILGDLDPDPIDTRQIEDPVEQSQEIFERSYTRIERCVREFAGAVAGG